MDEEVSMTARSDTYRVVRQPHSSIRTLNELLVDVVYPDRKVMETFAAPLEEAADDRLRRQRLQQLKPRRTELKHRRPHTFVSDLLDCAYL